MSKRTYTLGSTFSGIGGMDYAFASTGRIDIRWQVENDEYAQKILNKHKTTYWENANLYGDIRTLDPDTLEDVDIIIGGFPCQDISLSGTGAGIREGSRSGLWFQLRRLIGALRPRGILLENVSAITLRDGDRVIGDLTEMGYDARWGLISASDTYAPHRRERWFCVAFPNTTRPRCYGQEVGQVSDCVQHHASRQERWWERVPSAPDGSGEILVDSRRSELEKAERVGTRITGTPKSGGAYEEQLSESRLGGATSGTPDRMDVFGLMQHRYPTYQGVEQLPYEEPRVVPKKQPHWKERMKALGNIAMPTVVAPIAMELIQELDRREQPCSTSQ
jgi:DNA (cytosine-5)-methyltransferase 1